MTSLSVKMSESMDLQNSGPEKKDFKSEQIVFNESILNIQCDWNNIYSLKGSEAWVSCTHKDSPGIHGRITTKKGFPGKPVLLISEDFEIKEFTRSSITITHKKTPYSTVLLAPHQVFESIHDGSITSLDVSSEYLAVSSSKNDIFVWETSDGKIKLQLSDHKLDVYKCRFFPSGKVILSGGSDMSIKIWCATKGTCPVTFIGHKLAVTDLCFVDRGKLVISCSKDGSVKLWLCGRSELIRDIVQVPSIINCCKITTAPEFFLLTNPTNKYENEIGTENKIILIGCENGKVYCYSINPVVELFILDVGSPVNCLDFHGSEYFIVGCQDGKLGHYSLKNREVYKIWHESYSPVKAVKSYHADSPVLTGFFFARADGCVTFIHSHFNEKRIVLTGPDCHPVNDIACDGMNIYTCCGDGVVREYHVNNFILEMSP